MGFFGGAERDVDRLIGEHIDFVKQCVTSLVELFEAYFSNNPNYEKVSKKIHDLEHEADIVRRKIELKLHQGAFLPMFREDFITLSEAIDKIANKAEAVADALTLERPAIPEEWHDDFLTLTKRSVATFQPFVDMNALLDMDLDHILDVAKNIEETEQLVDKIEWKLMKKIFDGDLELARKLQLRDFVKRISDISDLSEDASDILEVLVVKRRI